MKVRELRQKLFDLTDQEADVYMAVEGQVVPVEEVLVTTAPLERVVLIPSDTPV